MTEHSFPYARVEFCFQVTLGSLTREVIDAFPTLSKLYDVHHEGDEDDAETFYIFTWANGQMETDRADVVKVPFRDFLAFIGSMSAKARGYNEGLTIRLESAKLPGEYGKEIARAYWTSSRAMDTFNGIKVQDDTISALSAAKLKLLDALNSTTDLTNVSNVLGALRPER